MVAAAASRHRGHHPCHDPADRTTGDHTAGHDTAHRTARHAHPTTRGPTPNTTPAGSSSRPALTSTAPAWTPDLASTFALRHRWPRPDRDEPVLTPATSPRRRRDRARRHRLGFLAFCIVAGYLAGRIAQARRGACPIGDEPDDGQRAGVDLDKAIGAIERLARLGAPPGGQLRPKRR